LWTERSFLAGINMKISTTLVLAVLALASFGMPRVS